MSKYSYILIVVCIYFLSTATTATTATQFSKVSLVGGKIVGVYKIG